jgi:hypothetical protein
MKCTRAFYVALLNLTARYFVWCQTPLYIISINDTVTYNIIKHARVHQFRKS